MDEFIQELKAFSFEGRINRLRYWKYIGCMFLLNILIGLVAGALHIHGTLASVISLALSIIFLPFNVRRVHDLDKSGWWLLVCLIPVVNFFFFIYVSFFKGTEGDNSYGADPLQDYEAARAGRRSGTAWTAPQAQEQAKAEPQQPAAPKQDKKDDDFDIMDVKPKRAETVEHQSEVAVPAKVEVEPMVAPAKVEPAIKAEAAAQATTKAEAVAGAVAAPVIVAAGSEPKEPQAPSEAAKPATCPSCGAPLEPKSKFCGNCGTKL